MCWSFDIALERWGWGLRRDNTKEKFYTNGMWRMCIKIFWNWIDLLDFIFISWKIQYWLKIKTYKYPKLHSTSRSQMEKVNMYCKKQKNPKNLVQRKYFLYYWSTNICWVRISLFSNQKNKKKTVHRDLILLVLVHVTQH
jgi:hypothetical protein